MLSKLKLYFPLEDCEGLGYQAGSVFQGVLMDFIDREYGEELHLSTLKPYSQYVFRESGFFVWQINALDERAKQNILNPIATQKAMELKQKGLVLPVAKVDFSEISYSDFINQSFAKTCSRYVELRFATPTAFKSDGEYIFFPSVKHILQSGINKFDAFSSQSELYDKETFEQILSLVSISRYNLKSTLFHLEATKIPSFVGTVTLKIKGPEQLVNLVQMIVGFATYSGIGIKTAIGMGAVQLQERGKTK